MTHELDGIKFWKMTGCGNDFIVVDNRDGVVKAAGEFARRVCPRQTAVGADGVLLIENSDRADMRMRIINPDGSEAEMCGNGARCAARFAALNDIAPERLVMETIAGPIHAEVMGDRAEVQLTVPTDYRPSITLDLDGGAVETHHINTGVPHAIVFVGEVDKVDVPKTGRAIRRHKTFAPAGANADFVQVVADDKIRVRTYERGVEDETLACGTGAVASALVALLHGKVTRQPVQVLLRGGELLVKADIQDRQIKDVRLTGEALIIYEGRLPEDVGVQSHESLPQRHKGTEMK